VNGSGCKIQSCLNQKTFSARNLLSCANQSKRIWKNRGKPARDNGFVGANRCWLQQRNKVASLANHEQDAVRSSRSRSSDPFSCAREIDPAADRGTLKFAKDASKSNQKSNTSRVSVWHLGWTCLDAMNQNLGGPIDLCCERPNSYVVFHLPSQERCRIGFDDRKTPEFYSTRQEGPTGCHIRLNFFAKVPLTGVSTGTIVMSAPKPPDENSRSEVRPWLSIL